MFYTDGNAPEPFSGLKSGTGLKSDAGRRVVAHYYKRSLGRDAKFLDRPIAAVELVGGGAGRWQQEAAALVLECPPAMPFRHAVGFRVTIGNRSTN